jgi:hypothetical protein
LKGVVRGVVEFESGGPLWNFAAVGASVALVSGLEAVGSYTRKNIPRWAFGLGRATAWLLGQQAQRRRAAQRKHVPALEEHRRNRISYSGPRRIEHRLDTLPPAIGPKID